MITKDGFVKLMHIAAKAYNGYVLMLESLGLRYGNDDKIMKLIDEVLNIAISESQDWDKTELIKHLGEDWDIDNANYWSPDMPLVIHFAWNLNFGDGGLDGSITKINLEGQDYELNTAADLYDCIDHFRQLRAHYGID